MPISPTIPRNAFNLTQWTQVLRHPIADLQKQPIGWVFAFVPGLVAEMG